MGTEETCEDTLEEIEAEIILRGARPRWMASSETVAVTDLPWNDRPALMAARR